MQRKVSVIGGGGLRTPLLVHGLLRAQALLNIGELQLYDVDQSRAELMACFARTGNREESEGAVKDCCRRFD